MLLMIMVMIIVIFIMIVANIIMMIILANFNDISNIDNSSCNNSDIDYNG